MRKERNRVLEESNGTGRRASTNIVVLVSRFEQFLLVLFGSKNCTCCIQGQYHSRDEEQGWSWQQQLCQQCQVWHWSQLCPPAAELPSCGTAVSEVSVSQLWFSVPALFASQKRKTPLSHPGYPFKPPLPDLVFMQPSVLSQCFGRANSVLLPHPFLVKIGVSKFTVTNRIGDSI